MYSSHQTVAGASGTGRGNTSSRSSRGHLAGLVAITVLIGLALGRFLAPPSSDQLSPDDPVGALENHLEANPDDVVGWHQLGTVHLETGVADDDTTAYVAARDAFERAEELAPGHPVSQRGLAVVALGLHQFGTARDRAESAHEARPADPAALAALVDAEVEMGHYDVAVRRLDQLLAVRPDAAALARASYVRELLGDGNGALDAMLRAQVASEGSSPGDKARVEALVGDVHTAQGSLEQADTAYRRALELRPDLSDAVVGRARVLATSGDVDGAIELLESSPDAAATELGTMLLVELYTVVGRDADAAAIDAELQRFIDDEVGRGFGLDPAVALHASTWGDPERGLELARQVYDARPDNVLAADALSWALLRSGDVEGARAVVEDAVRLDTHEAALHYRAAEVFAAAGDVEQARHHLERSRSINPHFAVGLRPAVDALAERLQGDRP